MIEDILNDLDSSDDDTSTVSNNTDDDTDDDDDDEAGTNFNPYLQWFQENINLFNNILKNANPIGKIQKHLDYINTLLKQEQSLVNISQICYLI